MDTSQQATVIPRDKGASVALHRHRRSVAEKRRIVEETLVPGASVARVARANAINANQVFGWRRLYLVGRLGERKPGIKLLPVRVSESKLESQPGTIHVELHGAQVRIEAGADPAMVRVLLQCLRA